MRGTLKKVLPCFAIHRFRQRYTATAAGPHVPPKHNSCCYASCMCKLIRFHKRVVFVDENNAVLHLRQITLPVFTRKHTARDITIYRYAAALPPAAHTEKRGRSTSFPRRTLSLQNSKIPTYGELDLNLVVSHHYRMLALHRTSPRRQSAAIKTSSSIVWTT